MRKYCELTAYCELPSQIFIQTLIQVQVLTLQFPAANAPMADNTPKPNAILLSMEWHACLSKIWAWWNIQNSRTKVKIKIGRVYEIYLS